MGWPAPENEQRNEIQHLQDMIVRKRNGLAQQRADLVAFLAKVARDGVKGAKDVEFCSTPQEKRQH